MVTTEVLIPATVCNDGETTVKKGNQKLKFAYSEHQKGSNVSVYLVDGRIDMPHMQIILDHDELKRVLEFLISAQKK